jgi:hypothetical protein
MCRSLKSNTIKTISAISSSDCFSLASRETDKGVTTDFTDDTDFLRAVGEASRLTLFRRQPSRFAAAGGTERAVYRPLEHASPTAVHSRVDGRSA